MLVLKYLQWFAGKPRVVSSEAHAKAILCMAVAPACASHAGLLFTASVDRSIGKWSV